MIERSDPWYLQQEMERYRGRREVLENENEELRERIKSLLYRGNEQDFSMKLKVCFSLTASEAIILNQCMKRETVRTETLMEVMYGDHHDVLPDMSIMKVFICKLRPKLKKFGVELTTAWGVGYYLNVKAKARVNELLAELSETMGAG